MICGQTAFGENKHVSQLNSLPENVIFYFYGKTSSKQFDRVHFKTE